MLKVSLPSKGEGIRTVARAAKFTVGLQNADFDISLCPAPKLALVSARGLYRNSVVQKCLFVF